MSKIENKIHRVTSSEMKEIEKTLAKMDYLKICRIDGKKIKDRLEIYDILAEEFEFTKTWDDQYFLEYLTDLFDAMSLEKQGFAIIIYDYSKAMPTSFWFKDDKKIIERTFEIACESYLVDCINYHNEYVETFFNVYLVD